jgi:glycosyltransferase involved in cell wall biosynthesis
MRIAMIGIKAIPARFGGFETAVDEVSRGLVDLGHEVVVYNRRGMSTSTAKEYEGVQLVTLPTFRTKNLSTICHSLLATLHVMSRRVDVVHYFTTGATLFAPLARLTGKKIVCSVDGTDWQRAKWGRIARRYLKASERFAARVCHALVADSREVQQYYQAKYRVGSDCITYGIRESRSQGNNMLRQLGLEKREYVLFVGRLVPENNLHHLIRAYEGVNTTKKLVVVGDDPWERDYIRSLKATRDPRIVFTGGIYGDGYTQLQQGAYLFVLPDEVGGTHPALVEAMGFGNCALVNDTPSNLEVIQEAGVSYAGRDGDADLRSKLQILLDDPNIVSLYRARAKERANEHYRWQDVVKKHVRLYERLLRDEDRTANAALATR